MSIIQSATEDGVVGAEAWRALKYRYDPETAITLEAWRGELFMYKDGGVGGKDYPMGK